MKRIIALFSLTVLLFSANGDLSGQSSFDPAVYKAYLETNKNLSADQLLAKNPAQTTYYSSRTNPANLGSVPWFDSINRVFKLTDSEKELIGNNFFMVSQRQSHYTWTSSLIKVYNNDLPLFLSSDYILHTLHKSYDEILLTLEYQLLEPNLIELLDAMYLVFPQLESKYGTDTRFDKTLDDVDLYVSVARSLLHNTDYLPQSQSPDKFNEIMDFIDEEKMASTPLFTEPERQRKIDFSQFTPRGHYTREIWTEGGIHTLENYFRAMMWLGRIDFMLTPPPLDPGEPEWTDDEIRRQQLGALLVNELMESSGKKANLDLHEKIISYMVGPDDNLTPYELEALYTELLTSPADLFDVAKFNEFKDSLNASDEYGQKIMSNFFIVDPYSSQPDELPISYRLLGQKFLIDSYVFSEVVYDRIIENGTKILRMMPDPLDAMAVLGNEDAMALLEGEVKKYNYSYKIDALKYLVDSYDAEFWEQSLYNTWLGAIRELNPPASSDNLPYFMQTTAWHHKTLNTQLCSWAELRHDNLLYAKQSYTGGTACSFPYTFVEPVPGLYNRLGSFADKAADFFLEIKNIKDFESSSKIVKYYQGYAGIMAKLEEISKKELAGTAISEDEITFLKTMINSYMASGPAVTGWLTDLHFNLGSGLDRDFVVGDVHTQPTDEFGFVVGHVLHVGNGLINQGVFLAPNPTNPEQIMAFAGPTSSFHYEITKDFKRLTDEEWQEKFMMGDLPSRPDWIAEYMTDFSGNAMTDGRKLKGEVFGGTFIEPSQAMNTMDYLLVFPNPAEEELHLRFVLNRKSLVNVNVYDITGKMVKHLYSGILPPSEHNIPANLSGWNKGVYIIKFNTPHQSLARKVLIK